MARKRKPLFGPSSYKKKPKKKRPDVIQKGPINTANENPTEDREENVFLKVDTYPIIPYI